MRSARRKVVLNQINVAQSDKLPTEAGGGDKYDGPLKSKMVKAGSIQTAA